QACDGGYYGDDIGACSPCPADINAWQIARPLLIFFGALLAVVSGFYTFLFTVAKAVGGTLTGGVLRMLDFLVWSVTVVQLLSQVGQGASPGLPDITRAAYAAINVFQFQGIALPPACIVGSYPFLSQVVQFGIVLLALGVMLALIPKVRTSALQ